MIIFYTPSSSYLSNEIPLKHGNVTFKMFSDGEIYVKIHDEVRNQKVWVIASTAAPAENILNLIFLLDALTRAQARIDLLITYFGYARQSRPQEGEASSAQVISELLKRTSLESCTIIHPHNSKLEDYISYSKIIPYQPICPIADNYECIVAPDKGSADFARITAFTCHRSSAIIEKIRPAHEEVSIIRVAGDIKGRRVLLVDDIISTGKTLIAAAEELKQRGAKSVSAYATHGIFSDHACERLKENDSIEHIYTTNSLDQKRTMQKLTSKLTVLSLGPLITHLLTSEGTYGPKYLFR